MIRLQLRTRYALSLLALLLATVGSLSIALLTEFSATADNLRQTTARSLDRALLDEYSRRAEDLSVTLAQSSANAVYFLQIDTLATIVDSLTNRADINAVAVFDTTGLLYFSGDIPGQASDVLEQHFVSHEFFSNATAIVEHRQDAVSASAPIHLGESVIGHILVNLSLAPIQEQIALVRDEQSTLIGTGLKQALWVSLGIALTFIGLGIVLAVFLGDRLSRPIDTLSQLARQIGQGNYNIPDQIGGSIEVRELLQSFRNMAHDLRSTTVSKIHLDNILQGMLDGLLVVDATGRIDTANDASGRLLGRPRDDLVGQPVSSFFADPTIGTGGNNGASPQETFLVREDGLKIPVLLSVSSLPDGAGTPAANAVWVFRDITSLRATHDALIVAMQESERANQAKSQFLANMSHELRTPLNAIIGYSEMLADEARDAGNEAMTPDLDRIRAAGRHLLTLIDDILDLSKIEAGKMETNRQEIALGALIADVVETVRQRAEERNNSLSVDIAPDLSPIISDAIRVRQILYNVLSNAAKFTSDGRISIAARAEQGPDGDSVTIAVSDTGIGMTEAQLSQVFAEFVQADSSTTREYGGTGLGLSISRQLAQMLGGGITATSTPGKGSVFIIRLPRDAGSSRPASAESGMAIARKERTGVADNGRLLLVVNSDTEKLDRIAAQARLWGFGVVAARDLAEARRLAVNLNPMAILLDPELADELQEKDVAAQIPRIPLPDFPEQQAEREQLLDRLAALLPAVSGRLALLVDDDEAIRRLVALSMNKAGWRVIEAKNGEEALARVREGRPDLVVLDLMMPVMDGRTFLHNLRSDPETATLPVMVVTGQSMSIGERLELQGEAETVIEKDASGWIETVKIMGSVIGSPVEGGRTAGRH